jgi:hypothetical protein
LECQPHSSAAIGSLRCGRRGLSDDYSAGLTASELCCTWPGETAPASSSRHSS